MAKLVNSLYSKGSIVIDERIQEKVVVLSTAPISDRISKVATHSIWAVAEQLEKEKILNQVTAVSCIFTKDGKVSIEMDSNQLGNIMRIILFPMERWEEYMVNPHYDVPIYTFIIEELAHHYWNIEDEVEVNYKVIEIMRHIFPNIKMEDVYSKEFMDNPTY